MKTIGDRIRELRTDLGLLQNEVAESIGVTKQTLYKYEKNIITNIPSDKIQALAKTFRTTPAYLMGWEDKDGNTVTEKPLHEDNTVTAVRIPVYGRVAAGIPMDAIEDVIDYEDIPADLAKGGEYFALQIKGDSMKPRMFDGDVVIVRKQSDADTGDTIIALINGNDACCKRLRKYYDGAIDLISTNPNYEPLHFEASEVEKEPVVILGKVVELRQKY